MCILYYVCMPWLRVGLFSRCSTVNCAVRMQRVFQIRQMADNDKRRNHVQLANFIIARIGLVRALQVLMYGEWIACKERVDPRIWGESGAKLVGTDKEGYGLACACSCRPVCIWKDEAALLPHQASPFQPVVLYFPRIFAAHISPTNPTQRHYMANIQQQSQQMQPLHISFSGISHS